MFYELISAFIFGIMGAALYEYLAPTTLRTRLYSLEIDLAALQDSHLRSVRRAAIKSRWDKDGELDEQLEQIMSSQPQPKTKGWTKWGSKSANSSGELPLEQ